MNWWNRLFLRVAPEWSLRRMRARTIAERHFEAAQPGRRTQGYNRSTGDANTVTARAVTELRLHGRDLVRNNGWARKIQSVISNNVVGWGILPKPNGDDLKAGASLAKAWKKWALDSTECDADGMLTMTGLQRLIISSIVESGEVLVRRRGRRAADGLTVPLQLQVIEGDYIDSSKNGDSRDANGVLRGKVIQGVEFNLFGQRTGYWMFDKHPGDSISLGGTVSYFYPISDVVHFYRVDRPGQVRGVSWLASAILNLKDLDEYEDAELMRQKIAACFAAFVTDTDGYGVGAEDDVGNDPLVERFEPGMVSYLPPGKSVSFGTPPVVASDSFATRTVRKIASGVGITYEDLTGDYSQVNFSSARMGRLVASANNSYWQQAVMIPGMNKVWQWFADAYSLASGVKVSSDVEWIAPPLPMLEPDKEGRAYSDQVRSGLMTFSEMIRTVGGDPKTHFEEYARDLKMLDALGLKLDSDPRNLSLSGTTQPTATVSSATPNETTQNPNAQNNDAEMPTPN